MRTTAARACGLIEGKTLKGTHLNLDIPPRGRLDHFPLDLKKAVRVVDDSHACDGFLDEMVERHEGENGTRGLRDVETG